MGAMTIRLVASDLDGTLFGPDHVPEGRTVDAVNALADAGVIVAAVTGRSWFGGAERAASTGARLDWFIGSNGGHRLNVRTQELEERLTFKESEVGDLISTLDTNLDNVGFGTEHAGGFWFSDRFLEQFPNSVDGGPRRVSVVDRTDHDIGKLFVSHAEIHTTELVDAVEPHVPDSMHVTTSGISFVEVTPHGADKGSALARLCAKLGIDRSEVIAFGDNYNDLTMLEWAGRGVAMGNAEDPVKAVADEVTATNVEYGVAQVLEALLET
jgi:Cof subfamily protein (haloacid dehalogenase superfamily)